MNRAWQFAFIAHARHSPIEYVMPRGAMLDAPCTMYSITSTTSSAIPSP